MTFEQFKTILNKIPNILTQIAFGITDIYANPDFFKMMEYARFKGIIPNYTAHGLDFDNYAIQRTVELCGVVCISVVNKEKTFEAIRKLHVAGMEQINIHYVLAEETYEDAFELIKEIAESDIIKKINALVFLDYKPKGKNPNVMHHLSSIDKYAELTKELRFQGITYGFDSCAAPLFLKSIRNKKAEAIAMKYAEPCESGIFSSYINVKGDFYPCSFSEGEGSWKEGISVLNCDDFLKDVWFNERVNDWRTALLNSSKNCDCKFSSMCRSCPVFEEINICKNAKISEVA
jgi:MoaA/NifB/PqqE/SkfB family radical SAM enzyme